VITAGNKYPPKPDPSVYSIAMERLGVDPQETIAFEDSVNGVRAAKQAGIFCVAVPNSVTVNMDFSESNLQLVSLLSISLQDLIKFVESP
jgi:putative hydrolase of the HAD superfamily